MTRVIIILLGILIAAAWQFGFSSIYTFVFGLVDIPLQSNSFLSAYLLLQSFVMGALPASLVVYFCTLPALKCTAILLTSIIITCVLIEVSVAGLFAVIGLALAKSTWIYLLGAVLGSYAAQSITPNK